MKKYLIICLFLLGLLTAVHSLEFWWRIGSGLIIDNPTVRPALLMIDFEAGGATPSDANYQQEIGVKASPFYGGGDFGVVIELLGRSWWHLNKRMKLGQEYSAFYAILQRQFGVRLGYAWSISARKNVIEKRNDFNISFGAILMEIFYMPFVPYLSFGYTRTT